MTMEMIEILYTLYWSYIAFIHLAKRNRIDEISYHLSMKKDV